MGISWYARAYLYVCMCIRDTNPYKVVAHRRLAAGADTYTRIRRSNILLGPHVWRSLDIPRRRLDLKFIGRKFFGDRPTLEAAQTLRARAVAENDRAETKLRAMSIVSFVLKAL